ncbi:MULTISPECIES: hypothetical protein [Pseudomonas]|uniref:Uncharacterized protein n=1 Tax=Pseudomonas flexibilis TaxID=706570 RepID=A0A1N6PG63_9PSED|nr:MULTISPECIES: hypothetical protein [Pseudomonas]KHL70051.1 hypothetical protein SF06_11410 [Pseudomonas flexibilis]SIQ03338.1 hypothetical protein SAMN05421672_102150 [Pseudomonas flexibilis]
MPRSPEAPEDDFRPRDHPVEDDIAFQRKAWKVERVGWACLLVLVVLALLGLFSNGPLSDRRLTTPDGTLQVDDQRFLRQGGRSPLRLALQGEPGATLQVVLEAPFLDTHRIEALEPHPLESGSAQGGLRLAVRADRDGRATLHFSLRPDRTGATHLTIRFGEHRLRLWQFIYP